MSLSERLTIAMAHSHFSQAGLARACGVKPPSVHGWLSGRAKHLRGENLLQASKVLGVNELWLATGKGPMLPTEATPSGSDVETPIELKKSRILSITGSVKGGDDGYLVQSFVPEGFVEYWTGDPEAFALRVKGDSMHPRYRAGEFVIVTPSVEPMPSNDVVVKLRNGKCLLKQLHWIRTDEIQLLSINHDYGPMTISLDEVECIHRVAGAVPQDALIV